MRVLDRVVRPLAALALGLLVAGCRAPAGGPGPGETARAAAPRRVPATSLESLGFVSHLPGKTVRVQFDGWDMPGGWRVQRGSFRLVQLYFDRPGVLQERTTFLRATSREPDQPVFPRPRVVVAVYKINEKGWHGFTVTAAPGRFIARVRGILSVSGLIVEAEQDDGLVPEIRIDRYGGCAGSMCCAEPAEPGREERRPS